MVVTCLNLWRPCCQGIVFLRHLSNLGTDRTWTPEIKSTQQNAADADHPREISEAPPHLLRYPRCSHCNPLFGVWLWSSHNGILNMGFIYIYTLLYGITIWDILYIQYGICILYILHFCRFPSLFRCGWSFKTWNSHSTDLQHLPHQSFQHLAVLKQLTKGNDSPELAKLV